MPFEFRKSVQQFSFYEQKAVSRPNRKLIFSDNNIPLSLLSILNIYRLNFENSSINTQVITQKPDFEAHFRFSCPDRKQISKSKSGVPYSALNSNYWRLNFENPSIGSRVMWRQHYDIQTDISKSLFPNLYYNSWKSLQKCFKMVTHSILRLVLVMNMFLGF